MMTEINQLKKVLCLPRMRSLAKVSATREVNGRPYKVNATSSHMDMA